MNDEVLSVSGERISITVWIAHVILILAFAVLGPMQLAMPIAKLADLMIWPAHVPEGLVRFIGAAEAAGALGLVLPLFTPLPAYLMRWAAFGLATVMVCALGYHIMLFQGGMLIPTGVLAALAVYVGVRRM